MLKSLIIFVGVIFLLCGCGKSQDELVMVTEAGFAPYEYYKNGEIIGVDIEIAKEIAKEMNKQLVVKDVAFDSIVNELQSGKADFAAAGMSITEERKKQVDFTIEYTTSNQVVVVKKDSKSYIYIDYIDNTFCLTANTTSATKTKATNKNEYPMLRAKILFETNSVSLDGPYTNAI